MMCTLTIIVLSIACRCCKEHDDCYVDEVKHKGCSKSYYFNVYKWQKDGSSVRCIKCKLFGGLLASKSDSLD